MVEFNPYDWKTHENPYPVYRRLRDEAPVYYNADHDFYALSRYDDVIFALRDPAVFSSADGVALEKFSHQANELQSFLAMDPPRHDEMRALIWRHFTRRQVAKLEPRVRQLAREYVQRFMNRGRCDLIEDYSARIPMDVVCEMIGIRPRDRDMLRGWSDMIIHRDKGSNSVSPQAYTAGASLLQYMAGHVARHREDPRDTLTDVLVRAEIGDKPLNGTEIVAVHFLLSVAGNETTTKLVGNAMYWLWKHPEQRERVWANPELIKGWVEETLRFDASSQMVARTAKKDVELHGVTIPEGSRVALLLGSANRDERVFDEPDRFDVEREQRVTMAFGHGAHYCLGASLARLEGRVCLQELVKRVKSFELDPAGIVRVHSPNVRGFSAVPMTFVAH